MLAHIRRQRPWCNGRDVGSIDYLGGGGSERSVLHTPGVAVDIAYGVGSGAVVGLLEMVVGRAGVGARLGLVGSLR
jgi:hypothetical protein